MDAHLHFPHVMFSGAERLIWEQPGQLPTGFFDELRQTGWAKTVYEEKQPILVSPEKVHFEFVTLVEPSMAACLPSTKIFGL